MTQQTINLGTADKGNGDPLRTAFSKVNANFTELYANTDLSAVAQHILPAITETYDLGSLTKRWRSLYVSENTVYFGNKALTINQSGGIEVDGVVVATPDGVQANADWNATSGVSAILNKPAIPADISDLTDTEGLLGSANLSNLKIDGNTLGTQGADSNSWGSYPLYLDPGGESDAGILIPGLTGQSNGDALAIYNRSDASSIVQVFGQGGVQVVTNTGVTEKIFEFTDNGTLNVPYPSQDSFRIRLSSENFVPRQGKATLTLTGDAWDFYGAFVSSQNGERQLAADNGPLPSITNPGYEDGDTFEIDSTVHGIPGYVLTVALSNVVQAGPAGWTANLAFSPPPDYPSTVNSQGAIKVTSNNNSWIFGTDGELTLPAGGDIVDSTGTSVLGGAAGPVQPYLEVTNTPFITQPVTLGAPVTVTAAPQGVGAQVVVTITEGSVLDSITIFEPGTGYVAGQNYIIYSYQIGGPMPGDSLTLTIGTVDGNGGILTVTNVQFLGVPQNVAGVYVTALNYQASVFDEIDTGLTLARDANQGIYNSEAETEYDNNTYLSPLGTEWNADGWGDLTGLGARTYTTWRQALNNQVGNYIVASELVMHDTINDKYYKFDFTAWGGSNGGYAYTRTEVTDPNYFRKLHNADAADVIVAHPELGALEEVYLETEGTWADARDQDAQIIAPVTRPWDGMPGYMAYDFLLIYTTPDGVLPPSDALPVKANAAKNAYTAWREALAVSVGITRTDNTGIYNPFTEEIFNSDNSPQGTVWNADGWNDLSNVTTRTYNSFNTAAGGYNSVLGKQFVMYVGQVDKYYAVEFTEWATNGDNSFAYTRKEIDLTKLNEGITFSDGTVLKSAQGVGRVKSTAPGNRRIEEVTGYNQVSVTSRTTNNYTGLTSITSNGYELRVARTPELDAVFVPINQGSVNATFRLSYDNTTYRPVWLSSVQATEYWFYYEVDNGQTTPQTQGDTVYIETSSGADPVVWWNSADLIGGGDNFRGAVIDYHAYTGESTIIGTIHIVDDSGEEHISHQEVQSGTTDGENDDLWVVQNEGTISYRRIDGENKTLKVHWTAKVFYGTEFYD